MSLDVGRTSHLAAQPGGHVVLLQRQQQRQHIAAGHIRFLLPVCRGCRCCRVILAVRQCNLRRVAATCQQKRGMSPMTTLDEK